MYSKEQFLSTIKKCHDFDIRELVYAENHLDILLDSPWKELFDTDDFLIKFTIFVTSAPYFLDRQERIEIKRWNEFEMDIQNCSQLENGNYLLHCNLYKGGKFLNRAIALSVSVSSFDMFKADGSGFSIEEFNGLHQRWWKEINEM